MGLGTVLNILALIASFAALAATVAISRRQTALSHRANQLPVIVELFKEMRSFDFVSKEEMLWHELPKLDPSVGFSRMPPPLREYATNIGNFYSMVAYLSALETVDDRLVTLVLHHRAVRTWEAIGPFVRGERAIRGYEHSFLNVLEAFIGRLEAADISAEIGRLQREFAVPGSSKGSRAANRQPLTALPAAPR
jgi:hypothetical protein